MTVLTDNSGKVERAFVQVFHDDLDADRPPVPDLQRPSESPAHLLPFLAADRGVGEWSAEANIGLKRQTVADQWLLRSLSGTGAGLRLAVSGVGFDLDLVPWHKMEPKGTPKTFQAKAYLGELEPATDLVQRRLVSRLNGVKSARDSFTLSVGVASSHGVGVAAVVSGVSRLFSMGECL